MGIEKFQPTREQIIEENFGRETLEEAASFSRNIFSSMKDALAQMPYEEGSSQQQKEKAKQFLEMWRDFVYGLAARTSSANAISPEKVETAIKGASSLLSVEPTREGEESAKKMIAALKQRY